MRELMDTMNRLSLLTAEFEGKVKVTEWYVVMASMNYVCSCSHHIL